MQFRRNMVTATNWENSSRRMDHRNVSETSPIEAPWPLDWNGWVSDVRSGLWGTGSGPLGGLRTSWDTGCAPNDSTNEICCYRAQNDRLAKCGTGSEGFPRICSDTLHATPNVLSEELRPKWLDEATARFHRQNLMITGSMEAPWLDLNWIGRKLQSELSDLVQLHKPSIWLAPSLAELCTLHWILLNSMVKYLDGISDGLGCVSQHQNRSMVVISSRNPQNSKFESLPPLGTLNIKS
jgi:hypothetical protein